MYYCPNCWLEIAEGTAVCPNCRYDLSEYERLPYEDKLLLALRHPVCENRMIAAEVLGRLRSPRAMPIFRQMLAETEDFQAAQTIVEALVRIGGAESEAVLRALDTHPSRLVRELARRKLKGMRHDSADRQPHADMPLP